MKSAIANLARAWKLFCALVIVVLRSRPHRRRLMFGVSLLAMIVAFLGVVAFDAFLTRHVLLFAFYWLSCGALVLLMLLLAVYDMIRIRAELTDEALRRSAEVFRGIGQTRESKREGVGKREAGAEEGSVDR